MTGSIRNQNGKTPPVYSELKDALMNYFISDTHFFHARAIGFDNRPFASVTEMDEEMIRRWNDRVTDDDTVYHLGDVSFGHEEETIALLNRLHGHMVLIKGNHDDKLLRSESVAARFDSIKDYMELPLDERKRIVLFHYPVMSFRNQHHGWIHFYGHVHTTVPESLLASDYYHRLRESSGRNDFGQAWNVGCMMPYMDYTPRTAGEIMAVRAL